MAGIGADVVLGSSDRDCISVSAANSKKSEGAADYTVNTRNNYSDNQYNTACWYLLAITPSDHLNAHQILGMVTYDFCLQLQASITLIYLNHFSS